SGCANETARGGHPRGHGADCRRGRGCATRWVSPSAPVPPLIILLADVAHLDLPAAWEVRRVSDDAALVKLHQRRIALATHAHRGPIRIAYRVAQDVDPVNNLLVEGASRPCLDETRLCQVI